jgi:hypothetical protein
VFDENDSTFWKCDERYTSAGVENTSSGLTDTSSTAHGGEYVVLESPNKLNITGFNLTRDGTNSDTIGRSPGSIAFLGKNSAPTVTTGWTLIAQQTTSTYTNNVAPLTISGNSNYFKYHAVVIRSIDGNQLRFHIKNIELFGTEENSSIPIQIGGGNIDKVANFRVYDKFVGEDQALEIWDAQKDEFGRVKSSMTLHKGRLGIGTTEPEGRLAVLDEPHNLEEFPPRAMTGYKTYMEGHGEFCASASDEHSANYNVQNAFNKITNRLNSSGGTTNTYYNGGEPTPRYYDVGNDYAYSGTSSTHGLGGVMGEWVKLEFPYKANISQISILPVDIQISTLAPEDFTIMGSSDDINWTTLRTVTGATWTAHNFNEYTLPSTTSYKYFALVVSRTVGANQLSIQELRYFGTREQGQSVLHDGQLTLTKSLTVPRIGPALDADDTPRRDRLVVEYNTSTNPTFEGAVRDTSGRGNDIIMHGNAKYDTSEKAFRLDGTSGTYMSGTQNLGTGTPAHTITGWFKQVVSLNNWTYVMFIGTSGTGQMSGMLISNTGQIVFDIFNTRIDTTFNASTGIWHHFAGVFKGGTSVWDNASTDLYINGQLEASAAPDSGTQYPFSLTGNGIQFGSSTNFNRYFNGFISQFKLYDTALTAEEVKTLYDMGRCDEGHHVVNFSKTRVGIGLGDGEAPGAALDIRGDVSIEGLVQRVGGARGLQIKTNNYVGSIISYDPSEPLNGNFLYQDIITITVYAPSGINYHWQRRMQISRVGSLVSLTGYIVYRANASSQTPYIILPWNQIGCNQRQLPTLVDNFGTGGWSVGGADDGLRLYGPGTVANGVQYNDIKLLVDVGMVGAYA